MERFRTLRKKIASLDHLEILEYCFYLFLIFLLRDYYIYKTTPIIIYLADEVEFTILNPNNSHIENNETTTINKRTLVDLQDFNYLINPPVCGRESLFLIIVVSSDPGNYEQRQAIRQTWGRGGDAVKIVFTFGVHKNPGMAEKILVESDSYGDIVQGNFLDAYRNLTYKHVMGLKWVQAHCWAARYVLKSDDDTFVHRTNLVRFLVRELSPWGTKNLIGCHVWRGMPVDRNNKSKWFVQKHEFEGDTYPHYCSGMFILYSQDVLPALVAAAEATTYFYVDDAFVTGILAEKVGIPRTNIRFLYHDWDQFKLLIENDTRPDEFVWGPCNLNPYFLRVMWNKTLEKNI